LYQKVESVAETERNQGIYENAEEVRSADQNVSCLPSAVCLAKKMGARMGGSGLL